MLGNRLRSRNCTDHDDEVLYFTGNMLSKLYLGQSIGARCGNILKNVYFCNKETR